MPDKNFMYPQFLVVITVFLSMSLVSGCASQKKSSKNTDESSQKVLYSPPADAEKVPSLPKGPPVIGDAAKALEPEPRPYEQGATKVKRALLDQFLAKGPGYALSMADIVPVKREGEFVGYMIRAMRDPDAAYFLGQRLRAGDVVMKLNGLLLENPDAYHKAWTTLKTTQTIYVDILRGDEPQQVIWAVEP